MSSEPNNGFNFFMQGRPQSPTLNPWDNVHIPDKQQTPIKPQRGGALRASKHVDHLIGFHNPAALLAASNTDDAPPRTMNATSLQHMGSMQNLNGTHVGANSKPHPMLRHGSVPVFTGIHQVS
eukprot:gene272-367_t